MSAADAGFGRSAILAYGALGLPLAFAALPIYVYVPRLYADSLGLSLATVGFVLLGVRVFDAVSDPLIGWLSDRLAGRRLLVLSALPLLAAGMVGLLVPPQGAGALWLAVLVTLVSLAYSVATIAYNAWGAEVAPTRALRTRVVASREAFALFGVVMAAALPGLLAAEGGEAQGLSRMAWLFIPLLMLCGGWTLLAAPLAPPRRHMRQPVLAGLLAALSCRPFRKLLLVFAANGIAAAIPSATVLFFVADVLQAPQLAGLFLVLYFLSAALSLPAWARVSQHIGKLQTWLAGMVLAVLVFAWASLLGAGETTAYAAICIFSGMALGADLAMPPSMLADLLAGEGDSGDARAGSWFGWWNFVTKANLALAAGLSLPLLGWLGYAPGVRSADALSGLATVYALLPVALKFVAIGLLWYWRSAIEPAPKHGETA